MATFAIYSYKFRDVENIGIFLGQEDDTQLLPTIKHKQDFLQHIFHDDLHGGRPFQCRLTQGNKKDKLSIHYDSKVVWEKGGLVLLMVSNSQKTITKHEHFQKKRVKDEPWCHVLIDNRPNREFMAIEKNSAFSSPDNVAEILQCSLRDRFAPHHATIDINNSYQPDAFWETVERYHSEGIHEVIFRFAAPNPAWQAALIRGMSNAAEAMNARPSATFTSASGAPLTLDKTNKELSKYVDACALGGEDILIKVKGIRSRISIKSIKDKYVLKQIPEDTFREILQKGPDLFDKDYNVCVAFLNQILTTPATNSTTE